jgi:hypothetical protein
LSEWFNYSTRNYSANIQYGSVQYRPIVTGDKYSSFSFNFLLTNFRSNNILSYNVLLYILLLFFSKYWPNLSNVFAPVYEFLLRSSLALFHRFFRQYAHYPDLVLQFTFTIWIHSRFPKTSAAVPKFLPPYC